MMARQMMIGIISLTMKILQDIIIGMTMRIMIFLMMMRKIFLPIFNLR